MATDEQIIIHNKGIPHTENIPHPIQEYEDEIKELKQKNELQSLVIDLQYKAMLEMIKEIEELKG